MLHTKSLVLSFHTTSDKHFQASELLRFSSASCCHVQQLSELEPSPASLRLLSLGLPVSVPLSLSLSFSLFLRRNIVLETRTRTLATVLSSLSILLILSLSLLPGPSSSRCALLYPPPRQLCLFSSLNRVPAPFQARCRVTQVGHYLKHASGRRRGTVLQSLFMQHLAPQATYRIGPVLLLQCISCVCPVFWPLTLPPDYLPHFKGWKRNALGFPDVQNCLQPPCLANREDPPLPLQGFWSSFFSCLCLLSPLCSCLTLQLPSCSVIPCPRFFCEQNLRPTGASSEAIRPCDMSMKLQASDSGLCNGQERGCRKWPSKRRKVQVHSSLPVYLRSSPLTATANTITKTFLGAWRSRVPYNKTLFLVLHKTPSAQIGASPSKYGTGDSEERPRGSRHHSTNLSIRVESGRVRSSCRVAFCIGTRGSVLMEMVAALRSFMLWVL